MFFGTRWGKGKGVPFRISVGQSLLMNQLPKSKRKETKTDGDIEASLN